MTARTFSSFRDAVTGAARKMATNERASDNVQRPVHHSEIVIIQATLVAPAAGSAYLAGDAIGTAATCLFEFNFGAAGLFQGFITHSRLIRELQTPTTPRFRAGIHDAAPATLPAADNAPHPQLWANRASRRGWIDFPTPTLTDAVDAGACLDYAGVLSGSTGGIPFDAADGIVRAL
ncbi:MAG: hypothetical protein Q8L02_04665, partial [Candidatus Nitrotoga sp.]|nr:hypothetical protein [Candidatus Nitrotoga sp.]